MRLRNFIPKDDVSDDIIFQVLDWYTTDETDDDGENGAYKAYMFGVTKQGYSISVRVDNFTPYFFVKIPDNWGASTISIYVSALRRKLYKSGKYLIKYDTIQRQKYYGFENGKEYTFVRLVFSNQKTMKSCMWNIKKNMEIPSISSIPIQLELYESNLDPVLRFAHIQDILMAGWVKINKYRYSYNIPKIADTEYDICANWKDVSNYDSSKIADGIRTLYFDIECTSADGKFPDPQEDKDYIIQIGNIVTETGSSSNEQVLFNLKSCDSIDNVNVKVFESEKDLLLAWAKYIRDTDPDIICGYNIFGFDLSYMYFRAVKLGIVEEFMQLTKLSDVYSQYTEKVMQSQQAGYNELKMLSTPGRLQIDLYQIVKREHKLTSYKLDDVGEHFVQEKKNEVTPQEIFACFYKDSTDRKRVGEYCIQDVNLCVKLMNKLCILPNLVEMSKVTRVPIEYLITRGQQIKAFSQIAYETRKNNFLIPVLNKSEEDEGKFKGATVLHANRGAYFDKPVCGLDFASLYPSIMIAHNMCYSTVIMDDDKYGNVDGIEYSTIEWEEECDSIINKHKFKFVINKTGLLSNILSKLWAERKATKKLMNAEKDPFQKSVYNGKQLAIKISMNSVYGFTGASNGMLPCRAISSSVTGCGRQMIDQTSRLAKELYDCEVIYGDTDSCYVIFPQEPNSPKDLSNLFTLATKAANEISKTFIKPIELEFEKFMWPFLLFAKKRYIYVEWTKPHKPNGIEAKGVELVRRDNCPYVKETLNGILDDIMYKRDINTAVEKTQGYLRDLLHNKVDVNKLVLSKTLKDKYKLHDKECDHKWKMDRRGNPIPQLEADGQIKRSKPTKKNAEGEIKYEHNEGWCRCMKVPHLQLYFKIYDRDPMSVPKKGERIPYIFIESMEQLQCKKVENPKYAKDHGLKPDGLYYVEHQMKHPLETIFDVLLPDTKVLFDLDVYHNLKKDQKKKEKEAKAETKRLLERNQKITKFFNVIEECS